MYLQRGQFAKQHPLAAPDLRRRPPAFARGLAPGCDARAGWPDHHPSFPQADGRSPAGAGLKRRLARAARHAPQPSCSRVFSPSPMPPCSASQTVSSTPAWRKPKRAHGSWAHAMILRWGKLRRARSAISSAVCVIDGNDQCFCLRNILRLKARSATCIAIIHLKPVLLRVLIAPASSQSDRAVEAVGFEHAASQLAIATKARDHHWFAVTAAGSSASR